MSEGIGLPELIVILCVSLLFLGAGKLKEIVKAFGKGKGEFKKTGEVVKEKKMIRQNREHR
jgi:TatA/E family protein of Tat protein translocase